MRIAKAGYPFIGGCFAAAIVIWYFAYSIESLVLGMLTGVAVLLGLFCAYFFRDPKRVIPQAPGLILSPADGKVVDISEGHDLAFKDPVWVLRIFLSVFDPHIQRSPAAGTVTAIKYTVGKFLDARDLRAHVENEQNRLEIRPSSGPLASSLIVVTQIAGLIARRIVCWVLAGKQLEAGEQFGLIRFGSQVDVVLPKTVTMRVKIGDRVRAGSSVIAEVKA